MRYTALFAHFRRRIWRFSHKKRQSISGAGPKFLKITIEIAAVMVYPIKALGRKPLSCKGIDGQIDEVP